MSPVTPAHRDTDVLVLGSGLAGLRAAHAAAAAPHLSVTVASPSNAPSGSSFTNRNNALGIQRPGKHDRDDFCREVLALARPGFVNPHLVRIMAEDAEARFAELEEMGLDFRRNDSGDLALFPGCGSRIPRAAIFDDLAHAHACFTQRAEQAGALFLPGFTVLGLAMDNARCVGAWGMHEGRPAAIRARTVIMAVGGPAPLFALNVSGRANPGYGHAILARAGTRMVNTGFLQFMWYTRDRQFRSPAALLSPGNRIHPDSGTPVTAEQAVGSELEALRSARALHCPAFFGQPQSKLDALLRDARHHDGFARIETPRGMEEVGLMAHAGNGGAVTDEHGATSVPGLFAVGECAASMHGANRMGGCMVLATQVFGHRAGIMAAQEAASTALCSQSRFREACADAKKTAQPSKAEAAEWAGLQKEMTRLATFPDLKTEKPELTDFPDQLRDVAHSSGPELSLAATAMLLAADRKGRTDQPFYL
ncbi:FAD-dependent oxidoreductase [Pseudodesulfovibrio tunisiensis]|uniref:FAD-dependent oxidoreductase n=1 Tax=Pseudodesulfovibrio tunisiensis TaxID=463192 RepID=UPI001FB3DADA|nr:FAD-binding protein [Pseudodesulfovibrio tunisiensis]